MPIKPSTLSTCEKGHLLGWHAAGRRRGRQKLRHLWAGDKAHRLPVSEVINNYQRSEVIDPLTVKFYFNKPSPGFLQGTATIGSGPVSLSTLQRNFEELGDARHIIGSGPFVVQDENRAAS